MNLEYEVTTDKPFDQVVKRVEELTAEKMFRVLHVHDVRATLAEKGFEREPLKIIEICNAKFAHEALQKEMSVSLFMPCKINVFTSGGKTVVKAIRPAAISEFFPEAGLDDLATSVDKTITDIVDGAVKGD
ncbi:MAG: DUF302 domain-containing protein [candidate division Zixibacteria bacterium]